MRRPRWLLLLLLCACPKSKAVNVEPELSPARAGRGAPSALYAWLRPPLVTVESRPIPLPADYATAKSAFDAASARYQARAYAEAAQGFMTAASQLLLGGPYAEILRANRVLAYRNAALAFREAGAAAEARRALDARAQQDPSCAAELGAIAGSLPER